VSRLGRVELALARVANRRGLYLGRRATRVHSAIYRRSGGRLGARMPGFPAAGIALVDHVGARSGTRRTSPLMFLRDGEAVVVVASKAGQPTHPAWFHNLMAHPDTSVQIGPERRQMRARTASEEERSRLWPRLVAMYPGFEEFARAAAPRQIPLVVLEPRP
jgi:deazaflavin-dependent oxidoreductase (nitroreductase family)